MTLTQKKLQELFHYDLIEGYFIRKQNMGRYKKDEIAGYSVSGYTYITVEGKAYPAHRLAFLYVDGYLPTGDVDHIDMNRNNNAYSNLRVTTRRNNMLNTLKHKDNTSGHKNIHYRKDTEKYSVRISVDGVYKTFGCFTDLELAELVAIGVREKYHGEFARHEEDGKAP